MYGIQFLIEYTRTYASGISILPASHHTHIHALYIPHLLSVCGAVSSRTTRARAQFHRCSLLAAAVTSWKKSAHRATSSLKSFVRFGTHTRTNNRLNRPFRAAAAACARNRGLRVHTHTQTQIYRQYLKTLHTHTPSSVRCQVLLLLSAWC